MSRSSAFLIVVAVWAVVYLPALGSLAIKGEEGRRILPAIRMLEMGDYVVPQVGNNPYFRKPPLVNWLVAASFKVFGVRNEWTARLPSALAVLALAIAFVTIARSSLGSRGSTVAALIWLTNVGMIEKGRLIEIEALYVSLAGLAIIFWLTFQNQKKSPWLTWVPAAIFLGLGCSRRAQHFLYFFTASCWLFFGGPTIGSCCFIQRTLSRSQSCSAFLRLGLFHLPTLQRCSSRCTSGQFNSANVSKSPTSNL
jgi:4-amino-4-deoxy-L-arabinose transferase-like glycosyltransferase